MKILEKKRFTNKTHYVKRVIGLPKEEIRIDGIDIYINNKRLEEPYAFYEEWAKDYIEKGTLEIKNGTWTLKEDEYFLMGDNRVHSMDSRDFGPVAKEEIKQIAVPEI